MKIVWLHDAAARDAHLVGEKAAALAGLVDRHAVPPGFCLPAMAPPEGDGLPTDLALGLADAYTQLARRVGSPAPAVAVRSSGMGEDGPAASFAGQHESYLNVIGLDRLTEAVQRCLASARSERAMAYREQQGLTGEVRIAVLVQQFIPADVSGVAFSINPQSGEDEVLITAAWGLGESLVGGTVTPDTYRVAKGSAMLLESRVAEKRRMSVAVPGSTDEVDVPRFLRAEPTLSPAQAQAVAQMAASIAVEVGHPVAIEFAFAGNRLYLLQCRPVTGVTAAALQTTPARLESPPDFPVVWDDPIDAEKYWIFYTGMYPDQVLPLYASFFTPWVTAWEKENPQIGFEFRRIHTYLYEHVYRVPDAPRPEERPFQTAQQLQSLWQSEILPELQSHILQLASMDLAAVPRQVLRAQLEEIVDRYVQIHELHWRIVNPVDTALERYRGLYAELFPGAEPLEELQLLQGFDNKSLESNRLLWRLSRRLGDDLSPLVQVGSAAEVAAKLQAAPGGRVWLAEFTAYLERYGRRFVLWDWTCPSWLEEPAPALQAVRVYLASPQHHPEEEMERMAAEREASADLARRKLAGYPHPVRDRFEAALRAAQVATMLKEDHDFWIDHRCMYEIRRALLTLGRRLTAGGLTDTPDAVWYLTLDELREVVSGAPIFSLHALLAERRAEMARWAGVKPPARLGTRPPERASAGLPAEEGAPLKGQPGSPGVARGRARILRTLADGGRLQPGEVLVAPALSPSWTPLYALAAAVVTEGGGVLSHSAIVARESRLPAVMGVEGACRRLRDGQLVEVDGAAGVVRLVAE